MMPGMRVDALWVTPSALFERARFPRLPNHAKPRHHHRLDILNSSLALANAGACRSEHGQKVRPAQQCGAHCARRHPLDRVLISARPQWPRDLRRLLPLSLTPLVAGRHGQVSTGGARTPLSARL